jgi:hypothetical protein
MGEASAERGSDEAWVNVGEWRSRLWGLSRRLTPPSGEFTTRSRVRVTPTAVTFWPTSTTETGRTRTAESKTNGPTPSGKIQKYKLREAAIERYGLRSAAVETT